MNNNLIRNENLSLCFESKKENRINWFVVLMFALQPLIPPTYFLIACAILFVIYYLLYFRTINKNISSGFAIYFVWGILAFFIGLILRNQLYFVLRSSFYWLTGIVSILLAIAFVSKNPKYDWIKTLCVAHIFITCYCLMKMFVGGNLNSYTHIRSSLSLNLEGLELLLPVLIARAFLYKKPVFGKKIDLLVVLLFLIRITICLSRTTIIGLVLGTVLFMLFSYNTIKLKLSSLLIIPVGIVIFVISALLLSILAPEPSKVFWDKFLSVFEEMKLDFSFTSYASALGNWRSYENYCAINQWVNYPISKMLFGNGFGGLIYMQYIPTNWEGTDFYYLGGIPLLHNTYLTILCNGGLIGLFSYLCFFLLGFKHSARKKGFNSVCLVVVLILLMVDSYVIRGLFASEVALTTGLLYATSYVGIKEDSYGN